MGKVERPELLWTVKYLAGSVSQWNRASDLRRARLMSYIHLENRSHPMSERLLGFRAQAQLRNDRGAQYQNRIH